MPTYKRTTLGFGGVSLQEEVQRNLESKPFFCTRVFAYCARVYLLLVDMVKGLAVEDRLDGVSNYGSWEPRVLLTLEKNDVKDFALKDVPFPDDATQQTTWRKSDVKARKILMDLVRNHLVSYMAKAKTTKEIFDLLKRLFERDSTSRSISSRM